MIKCYVLVTGEKVYTKEIEEVDGSITWKYPAIAHIESGENLSSILSDLISGANTDSDKKIGVMAFVPFVQHGDKGELKNVNKALVLAESSDKFLEAYTAFLEQIENSENEDEEDTDESGDDVVEIKSVVHDISKFN